MLIIVPTRRTSVFLSFRGNDGEFVADSVDLHARRRFGDNAVFRSSRSIGPGEVFPPELVEAIDQCLVMLVMVGPNWFRCDDAGRRRIDDPDDWVRREVGMALAGCKRVVVVRLGGAPRLTADDLPDDIADLALRQDVEVSHKNIAHLLPALMDDLFRLEPELRIGATDGLVGLDEWWARWSGVTRPPLSPALLVAGRDAVVDTLAQWLAGPPGLVRLRCASHDEGSAFVAAALELRATDVRAVLVSSAEGAAHCRELAGPFLVVVATSDVDVNAMLHQGQHVLLLAHSSRPAGNVLTLPRLSAEQAQDAFVQMGLPPGEARSLAGAPACLSNIRPSQIGRRPKCGRDNQASSAKARSTEGVPGFADTFRTDIVGLTG